MKTTPASITRATNELPLHSVLWSLLDARTMGVKELADEVHRAGYKSNAADFTTVVNLTLLKRKDLFKRVGRGQYTAK